MQKNLKELKKQGKALKPILVIGKEGLSENGLDNIRKNLIANKLTKIKLSTTYLDSEKADKKAIAKKIADKLKAEVIDVVGFVVVLHKK